jgi:hypothetical protein
MQFNRLSAFTLGVIITAASVGAVTYANAASNGTLKACANKTTGSMRYISRGSCKKTETSLSWNQMGSQGLPGVAGAKGDTGAAGTNGINGSNGTTGTNGSNGQNFHVIDAAGRDLGVALSSSASTATIVYDDGIWNVNNSSSTYRITGDLNDSGYFSDSSCVTPYWVAPGGTAIQVPQARGVLTSSGVTKFFKASGTPFLGPTSKFYNLGGSPINGVWQCVEITDSGSVSRFRAAYYTNVVEATPPTFTAPFTIVAR